jgi:hypothetical protein
VKATRAVAAVGGLVLLPLQLPGQAATIVSAAVQELPAATPARVLTLSDQARRFLALQSASTGVEFLGCMIGEIRGGAVWVDRIAPADVAPSQATATWVVPTRTCEQAGWGGTVGMIHSHPTGDRCWYYFPGTQVPTSDGHSFLHGPYPVDAILCGARVVWIGRDVMQQEMPVIAALAQTRVPPTAP